MVSLIRLSPQILGKTQTGVFLISGFMDNRNENYHDSRNSHDIDMKLGPVTKHDKGNTLTSKKLTTTSYQQIVTSMSFFQFQANLQPSGSRIPDGWSKKLAFLLIVTFYLTEPENRTKKSRTQLLYITFSKGTIFVQKQLIFCKNNADIINIKEVLVLKGIFSKTACLWEYFRTKFQVSSTFVASLRQGSWGGGRVILILKPQNKPLTSLA